jgi:hypothetical protein
MSMSADLTATTTITFEQLTKYFHLPINDVAKELGICATMLKKICRKNGIPRWPHRKIKSLNKMIENLEASLQNNTSEAEECIKQEINILKNKKSLIMKNPSILVQGGGAAAKRALIQPDIDGRALKKIRPSDEDGPVATISLPTKSSLSTHSNSLSINQLLTPNNPFSTPLTSYLLSEEKDDKDGPKRESEQAVVLHAAPSSSSTHDGYYTSKALAHHHHQQQQPQSPTRYYPGTLAPTNGNMPNANITSNNNTPNSNSTILIPPSPNSTDYHHRASVEFLTSMPHSFHMQQQHPPAPQQQAPQESSAGYVLPKINFSNGSQSSTNYPPSPSPKFRPPSPITSSHQQTPFAAPPPDAYPRHMPSHYFHYLQQHPHQQLPPPANGGPSYAKVQYPPPIPQQAPPSAPPPMLHQQSPQQLQQIQQMPHQHHQHQQHSSSSSSSQPQAPVVLRWVMEYDKPGKK